MLAFRRGEFLVVGSLADAPYPEYWVVHPAVAGGWWEVFNSDAAAYGGDGVGNRGATLSAAGAALNVVVPARGFVVLRRAR